MSPCLDVSLVTVFRYSEILLHIQAGTCLLVVISSLNGNCDSNIFYISLVMHPIPRWLIVSVTKTNFLISFGSFKSCEQRGDKPCTY